MNRHDIETLAAIHSRRIGDLLSEAEVHLTGSASLPELNANDVDLVVLVGDVHQSAAILRDVYPPLHEEQWNDDWAGFRVPGPPQVDVVLTRRGSTSDARHRFAWDLLAQDRALLTEYATLKRDAERYEERKRAFFENLVERLRPEGV